MATASLDAKPLQSRSHLPCECGSQDRIEVDVEVIHLHPCGVRRVLYLASECTACGTFEVTR